MHYVLAYVLLGLLYTSVVADHFQVIQQPRFYGVKVGKTVCFICTPSPPIDGHVQVEWHKTDVDSSNLGRLLQNSTVNYLTIKNVNVEDSGMYFCHLNKKRGFGSELQVLRHSDPAAAEWRSNMKDMIIFLQGFLLVLCLVFPAIRYYNLGRKEEAVYEEPVNDHTYEGLEIEQCGDLYEELTAYTQTCEADAEAPWEVESPEQE